MHTCELFQRKTVFSFEVFPPKKTSSIDTIYDALREMRGLSPDFISVTYGAAGNGGGPSVKIAADIKNQYGIESVAHLPCADFTREGVLKLSLIHI